MNRSCSEGRREEEEEEGNTEIVIERGGEGGDKQAGI